MPSLNHSGRRRANGCPDQVNTQADNRADNEADNESSIESCVSQDKFETSNVSLPSQQQMSFSCEHSNSCFQQTNGKRFVHQHHFHIPRKGTLPSPLQSTSSSRPISSNKVFCSQKIIKICHIWIPVTAFELPAAPIKSIHESIMKPIQSEYPKRLIRNNQVHPFLFSSVLQTRRIARMSPDNISIATLHTAYMLLYPSSSKYKHRKPALPWNHP